MQRRRNALAKYLFSEALPRHLTIDYYNRANSYLNDARRSRGIADHTLSCSISK